MAMHFTTIAGSGGIIQDTISSGEKAFMQAAWRLGLILVDIFRRHLCLN